MLLFLSNIYFFLSLAIYLAVNMYVVGQNQIPLSKEIENQTRLNHFNLNFITNQTWWTKTIGKAWASDRPCLVSQYGGRGLGGVRCSLHFIKLSDEIKEATHLKSQL